jgi:hypothetical protein
VSNFVDERSAGAEARADFIGLIGTTEVMPCDKAIENWHLSEVFRSL